MLPKGSPIMTTLLKEHHDGPIEGHMRVLKTYKCKILKFKTKFAA